MKLEESSQGFTTGQKILDNSEPSDRLLYLTILKSFCTKRQDNDWEKKCNMYN